MNVLDLLFPHPCIYCGKYLKTDKFGLCEYCRNTLPIKLNKHSGTWYLFEYDKRISNLLKSSKYAGRPYNTKVLGLLLGKLLYEEAVTADAVIYVPMHRSGITSRGYNQGRVAAVSVSKMLKVPLVDGVLRKKRKNRKQAGLGRRMRRINVRDIFDADGKKAEGKRIVLVDDIMTTGSTLNECEKSLLYAGALKVIRAVIAYTPVGRNR